MTATEDHANRVLDRLWAESWRNESGIYWTGRLTAVVNELVNLGAYTAIRDTITRSGCAEQVQRGGGNAPSIWRLNPKQKHVSKDVRATTKLDILEQRVKDLERLVGGVDVPLALIDLKGEIDAIRADVP